MILSYQAGQYGRLDTLNSKICPLFQILDTDPGWNKNSRGVGAAGGVQFYFSIRWIMCTSSNNLPQKVALLCIKYILWILYTCSNNLLKKCDYYVLLYILWIMCTSSNFQHIPQGAIEGA